MIKRLLTSLVQLEYSGFDGATVPICTFTLENDNNSDYLGAYIKAYQLSRVVKIKHPRTLEAIKNQKLWMVF